MGMRVNTGSGVDPSMVDKLIEIEKLPIKNIEKRKAGVTEEQKAFHDLVKLVSDLGTKLQGFRTRQDFYRMKLESSHPDVMDGTVDNSVMPGSFEVEVKNMARTHKLLAESFPDKDETPVGYGYMTIELEDGTTQDIEIDPDHATLQEVAQQINNAQMGAKAVVLNTKENLENPDEDNYRLLVLSEKSGKQAKVYIDPDTTYLEFKEQVTGQNLEVMFEDVPVYSENNTLNELMPGMVLNAKRAEPGTRVTLNIAYDVDKTMEGIKGFVETYNKMNEFIDKQFQVDPQTQRAGILAKDNTLKTLRRAMQNGIQYRNPDGKIHTLADIGITTDAKSGALKMDEAKVKQNLAENYEGVAKLFIQTNSGPGFGTTMSDGVRGVQNAQAGVLSSKEREYTRMLKNFDDDIAKKQRMVDQRAESIKRRFAAMESLIGGLNAQGQAMQARLAGGG